MAFKELLRAGNTFLVNNKDYHNAFECYFNHYLMWVASLKKRNLVLELIRAKRIYISIGK